MLLYGIGLIILGVVMSNRAKKRIESAITEEDIELKLAIEKKAKSQFLWSKVCYGLGGMILIVLFVLFTVL